MLNRYASLRQGLVGAWCPSLGASGFRLIDRSGYNNHGVLTGMDPGTDWVPSGGKLALDFDGTDDYVSTPVYFKLPFSVSLWFFGRSDTLVHQLWTLGNTTAIEQLFAITVRGDLSGDPIHAQMRGSDSGTNTRAEVFGYLPNRWNHVVATFNSTSYRQIWLNGVSGTADTQTYDVQPLNTQTIGALRRTFDSQFFDGQVDDVRQYSRVLTPSEVRLLYTGGRGVGLMPERIKHRRKTSAAATNRRRRIIIGASQ